MIPETALFARLQDDLTWRIRELSELVRACKEASGTRKEALLRASVPIFYAHWEGYFVHAANAYLIFVAEKNLSTSVLRDEFWVLTVRKIYHPQQINGGSQFARFLMDIRSREDRIFKKGNFDKINGLSNLKVDVLRFCCNCIGLNSDAYLGYFDFIDKDLIDRRNHIAHGMAIRFDEVALSTYRDKVIDLMRITHNEIENSVAMEFYKKSPIK